MLTLQPTAQLPRRIVNRIPVLIVIIIVITVTAISIKRTTAFSPGDPFIDLEQQIKEVFNNVAHHSTTKRSIAFDFIDPINSGRYDYRQVYRRPYPAIDVATTTTTTATPMSSPNTDNDDDDDSIATLIGANNVPGSPSNQFRANNRRQPMPTLPAIILPEDESMTMPPLPIDFNDYFSKTEQSHSNKTKSNQKTSNDVTSSLLPNQSQNESQFEYGSISEITSGIDRILGDANNRRNNLSKFLISVAENSPITTTMTTMSTITTTTKMATMTTTTTTILPPFRKSIPENQHYQQQSNQTKSSSPQPQQPPPPLLSSSPTNRIATNATSDKVWFISWNVHVYLIVICNLLLLSFSVYKLATFNEKEQFLFHKKHFRPS